MEIVILRTLKADFETKTLYWDYAYILKGH